MEECSQGCGDRGGKGSKSEPQFKSIVRLTSLSDPLVEDGCRGKRARKYKHWPLPLSSPYLPYLLVPRRRPVPLAVPPSFV